MSGTEQPLELLFLGLGNVLCGDDGVGVAAVSRLLERFELPPGVSAQDGGTLGLALLPWIRSARTVVLLDAVLAEAPPGTVVRVVGEEVGLAAARRLSVHQVGVHDLLESARFLGGLPERVILLGVVPSKMELEVALTQEVAGALEALVDAAVTEAANLGHHLGVASGRASRRADLFAQLGGAGEPGQ